MVAALDTIKTRKSGELKSQLNVYQNTKTQEIQKIKGSVFAQGMQNVKFNPNDSIFNHPALANQSQNVQQAQVQKTNADSTSVSLADTVTKLINNVPYMPLSEATKYLYTDNDTIVCKRVN